MDAYDLVPVDKVLKDMYDPNGGPISWAARDYYYIHYATPEERNIMDREDRFDDILTLLFWIIYVGLVVFAIIMFLADY